MLLHVEVARAKLAHGDTDVAQQMEIIAPRSSGWTAWCGRSWISAPVELKIVTISMQQLVEEIADLAPPGRCRRD